MVIHKPQVDPSGIYSNAQAAEVLGVKICTIQRWQNKGLIDYKVRKTDGKRVMPASEIIRAWRECN